MQNVCVRVLAASSVACGHLSLPISPAGKVTSQKAPMYQVCPEHRSSDSNISQWYITYELYKDNIKISIQG